VDAINRFHDVAELYLGLAAQHHGAAIPRDFMQYWDEIDRARPGHAPLGYKAQMQRLNRARVNLKHYGIEPSDAEIATARAAVTGMLEDEAVGLFGVGLHEADLSAFVVSRKARDLLDSAEAHWPAEPMFAFADLSEAFDAVISDYADRKITWSGKSVFDRVADLTFLTPFFRHVKGDQARFEEAITQSLRDLGKAVQLIGFGIDLRRYGRFETLVPSVFYTLDGTRHVREPEMPPRRHDEDFVFARDFVVATGVHLAAYDYDVDLKAAYDTHRMAELEAARAAEQGDGSPEDGVTPST
jgi:hypothetical protein